MFQFLHVKIFSYIFNLWTVFKQPSCLLTSLYMTICTSKRGATFQVGNQDLTGGLEAAH